MKMIRLILSALTLFCMVACNSGTNQSDTNYSSNQSDIKCTFDFKWSSNTVGASMYDKPYHVTIYNDNRLDITFSDQDYKYFGYMEERTVKRIIYRAPSEEYQCFINDFNEGKIYRTYGGARSRDPNDVVAIISNYKRY